MLWFTLYSTRIKNPCVFTEGYRKIGEGRGCVYGGGDEGEIMVEGRTGGKKEWRGDLGLWQWGEGGEGGSCGWRDGGREGRHNSCCDKVASSPTATPFPSLLFYFPSLHFPFFPSTFVFFLSQHFHFLASHFIVLIFFPIPFCFILSLFFPINLFHFHFPFQPLFLF